MADAVTSSRWCSWKCRPAKHQELVPLGDVIRTMCKEGGLKSKTERSDNQAANRRPAKDPRAQHVEAEK